MRHLGLEVHRLEKLMARQRGYSAAHQDADRQTGMHGYLLRYLYENQERDVFQRDIEKAFSISRSSVTVTLQLMEKNRADPAGERGTGRTAQANRADTESQGSAPADRSGYSGV